MKKNKKVIMILAFILIVIIGVILIVNKNSKTNNKNVSKEDIENNSKIIENNVKEDQFGYKNNISKEISKEKEYNGLKIEEFQIQEKDGKTELHGYIKNDTDSKKGGYIVKIKLLNEENLEITSMQIYFKEVQPGQKEPFYASVDSDVVNVYSYEIEETEQMPNT